MFSFLVAIAILIGGYFVYGKFVERVFGMNAEKPTPAYTQKDDVDYMPLSTWRVFLIQFLNIAGLGPIFGAIMGIMYGPAAYLWIVFGTIFGGAVHDYLSGMLSLRRNGASLPELVGDELGSSIKQVMRAFALILMILVGAVFVINPAGLINGLTIDSVSNMMSVPAANLPEFKSTMLFIWVALIFAYYILATLLPIDKLIGKIYPIMGFALLFMAVGIMVALFIHADAMPEIFSGEGLANRQPEVPIFPMMFVSIACGAISGFHATQSPLMARCLENEKYGRPVFYGAMVSEGIVALIWAAAAITYMNGSYSDLATYFKAGNTTATFVNSISTEWLGTFGGILALLGVVAAPITSGDTALRSARLIAADFLHFGQHSIARRLAVSIPIFILTAITMFVDYSVLWRYFGWCNQALSVFTLWALSAYLVRQHKAYIITLLPALFMTMVCVTYVCVAPEMCGMNGSKLIYSYLIGGAVTLLLLILFIRWIKMIRK